MSAAVSGEVAAQQPLPDFVRALEGAPFAAGSPATEPDRWLLAHVDVETTGLVPGFHEMIDLGLVMTDLDGRVLDSLFLRIQPRYPERTSEGARRVNDFDAARWRAMGALSPEAAVDSIVRFHRRVAGDRPTLMVAFNSQFDAAFLDHLFRARGSSWRTLYHYFVLDLPSMAWAQGLRELTGTALSQKLGIADEPRVARDHTGITGAMLNVRIYQALQARAAAPAALLGEYEDDYGSRHSVRAGEWVQHPRNRFVITHWDTAASYLIARNADSNPEDAGRWTRIDWVPLAGMPPYEWAFCFSTWNAPTAEAAAAVRVANKAAPRTGCAGHPFTRLKRRAAVPDDSAARRTP